MAVAADSELRLEPSLEQARELAEQGNVVPVCTRCGYEAWPCETSRLATALLAILALVGRARSLVPVP